MARIGMHWDAKFYQENSDMQKQSGSVVFAKLNPCDGEKILDIGCGNGLLSIMIAKQIPKGEVIAIDASTEMIDLARKNIEKFGIKNIKLLELDAMAINFKEEFDAIFSNIVFNWIKKQRSLYAKMFNNLKKGGRIVVSTLNHDEYLYEGETERDILQIKNGHVVIPEKEVDLGYVIDTGMVEIAREEPFCNYMTRVRGQNVYSARLTRKYVEKAGFTGINITRKAFSKKFDTWNDYFNNRLSSQQVAFLTAFPEDVRRQYIDRLKQFTSRFKNVHFTDHLPVIIVTASKPHIK